MLKAFEVSETDTYAAASAEQAAELRRNMCGGDDCDEGYPRELTDAELDREHPAFDEDEQPTGGTTTIRKMLEEHGDEPGWLCTTAW